jgi:hypothetical protein
VKYYNAAVPDYEPGGATSDLSDRQKPGLASAPASIEDKEVKSFGDLSFRDKPSPVAKAGEVLLLQEEKVVSLELAFRSKPSEVSTKHKVRPTHEFTSSDPRSALRRSYAGRSTIMHECKPSCTCH